MKVIALLPDARFFQFVKQTDDWYIFEDRYTPMVKIYSPDKNIRGRWCILISMQNSKSDKNKYPYSLVLKLFPIDDTNRHETEADIIRNVYKSKFAHSQMATLFYAAFPKADESLVWVGYSFVS